jgi:hypothetical protein
MLYNGHLQVEIVSQLLWCDQSPAAKNCSSLSSDDGLIYVIRNGGSDHQMLQNS